MKDSIRKSLPAWVLVLALCACDNEPIAPALPEPAQITLAVPDTLPVTGTTVQLTAAVLDAGGATLDSVEVAWTTSDPNRATVDGSGLVTTVATGPFTITARSGDTSASVSLRGVRGLSSSSVNLTPVMQAIGTTRQLHVEARDSANQVIPDPQVVFTSSDPSIITVDSDGLLRAVALGRAFVNVRIENQEHSVFMQVVTGYDVLTEIGTLGGDSSRAFAVNDQGYVAGDAQTASGEWHAFVYRGGEITDVGPSGVRSRAVAVNASGTVIGNAFPTGDTIHGVRPFQWKDGVTTYLRLPEGSESGFVRDINDSGIAVGYSTTPCSVCAIGTVGSALRWDDGVLTDLGRLGGQQGYATAINAEGRIAGGVGPGGGGGWVENGAVVNVLPTLVEAMSDAGHLISRASEHIHLWHDGEDHLFYVGHRMSFSIHGVDGAGEVIIQLQRCSPSSCSPAEAAIRLPDDRVFGLNDIITPVTSWRLAAAMGMSENGLIAGYGRATPAGPVHAVVLKPRS